MVSENGSAEDAVPPSPPALASTTRVARNARNTRAREGRPASGAQLYRLNALGKLVLVDKESESIQGAVAFRMLSQLKEQGLW